MEATTGAAVPVSPTGAPKTGRSSLSKMVWAITVAAAAVTLVTAFWGFSLAEKPDSWPAWQSIVLRTIKSLTPPLENLADKYRSYPPQAVTLMVIAQAAGAIFSLLVVYRVLLLTLSVFFAEIALRRRRRHDVVIGSGPAAAEYVAGAERKTTHTAIELESAWGRVATLARVGSLDHQLARAGSRAARRIIVDEGDDATTWETAQTAARHYPDVDVVAHIRDPWIHEKLTRASPAARLNTFSYASGVARQVMLAHPPYLLARRYNAPAQHILIFGFGAVGQALAREFLVTSLSIDPQPMIISAVDPHIADRKAEFLGRLPGLGQDVTLNFIPGDLRLHGSDTMEQLKAALAASPVCAIYVAIDNGSLPLSFGLDMRDQARELGVKAPIFICAQHGAGLAQVSQGSGMTGQGDDPKLIAEAMEAGVLCDLGLVSFGAWSDALDGSGLFEPRLDGHAKIFHEAYLLRHPPAPGQSPDSGQVKWERLSDEFRVANRRAAAHIRAKADAAGYDLEAWLAKGPPPSRRRTRKGWRTDQTPPAATAFNLDDPAFVDRMADLEHRRWMIDRALNGWKLGPRNDRLKMRPTMIPTKDLSEEEKQKDRDNVALTAEILKIIAKRR